MTSLEIRGLSGRARGQRRRIQGVSLSVRSGFLGAVFGRPDAGKRALLRLLAGLDAPDTGEVLVDGNNVSAMPPHRRRLGVVLLNAPMFPGTVLDNVVYGLREQGWAKDDRERRVAAALELVGMSGTEAESASALNADERARIALARALAPQPQVLLLEYPTAHVDEVLKPDYRARLREVLRSIPLTTLILTDDLRDAVGMADDLHVLASGTVVQSGPLSRVLAGPATIEVAEMVGYVTLIRGQVDGDWILEPGSGAIQFPAGFPLAGTARALAHPAAMLGVPEASGLGCGVTGLVERVRAVGPTYLLDLRVGDRLVEVRWEWDSEPPDLDEPIAIAVTPGTLRYFNEPTPTHGLAPAVHARSPHPDEATGPEEDTETSEVDADEATETTEATEATEATETTAATETPSDAADEDAPSGEAAATEVATDGTTEGDGTAEGDDARPPSPAPAPPRGESGEVVDESVEALAPWLQVARPVPPPREPDAPEERARRHQGMPLD